MLRKSSLTLSRSRGFILMIFVSRSHMKSVEMKTQQLKHEEEKLNQMKQDILKESNLLEQQREQVEDTTLISTLVLLV